MRKILLIFLVLIVSIVIIGCDEKSIIDKITFSNVNKMSFQMPNDKEIIISSDDIKKVCDTLSKAKKNRKITDYDGGICINAYHNKSLEFSVSICNSNYIVFSVDKQYIYELSDNDYQKIINIYEIYNK